MPDTNANNYKIQCVKADHLIKEKLFNLYATVFKGIIKIIHINLWVRTTYFFPIQTNTIPLTERRLHEIQNVVVDGINKNSNRLALLISTLFLAPNTNGDKKSQLIRGNPTKP